MHFKLTALALTINLDPLRRLKVWGAPTLSSVESREKSLKILSIATVLDAKEY